MSKIDEYLIVKAHGIIARLIPVQSLLQMAYSKELKDIVSLLMMTDYRTYIDKIDKLTATALYSGFKRVMIDRFQNLINSCSGASKEFIIEYMRLLEFENVMRIIGRKLGVSSGNEIEITRIGTESINYDELMKASSIEQLMMILRTYDPYSGIRDEIARRFIEEKNLLILEYELHRIRYSKLLELINNFAFIDVRDQLKKLIGIEIDILNIYAVTGPILYGFSPELTRSLIIPGGYLLSRDKLIKVLGMKRKSEIINQLRGYEDVLELILNKRETKAYLIAQKKIRKELMREKIPNYATFLDVFICLKLVEFEYRDLTQIVYGVEYNIPRDTLQKNLINY